MKAIGYLLTTIGVLLLVLAGWYVFEAVGFLASSETATGTIVEHKFTGGLNRNTREVGFGSTEAKVTDMFAPIVEFETTAGSAIRFQANWSEGDPPPVGTAVSVRYLERTPGDARISSISSLFGGAAIVAVLGVILAGAGWLVLRRVT